MIKYRFTFFFLIVFISMTGISDTISQNGFIQAVVSLTGSIISDACYGEICHGPVTAKLEAYDESGKRIYKGKSNGKEKGYYFITGLHPGQKYKVVVNDSAYLHREIEVIIPLSDKYIEFSKDFLVVPKAKFVELYFHVPPFELRKTKIRAGENVYLDEMASLISQNPDVKFEIECFPDDDANADKNLQLTVERCNSLKEYFVSKGIRAEHLSLMPNVKADPLLPPPHFKIAKGKRYIGSTYIIIKDF